MKDRDTLKAMQGQGARYDAPEAPAEALLLARRGTAYFARFLNGLGDAEFTSKRRAIIARVGYDARDLAQRLKVLATHGAVNAHPDPARRLALGANLPARALRHLFQHTEVHLNVAWRDLPGPLWARDLPGVPEMRALDCPLWRAQAVWTAALALDAGGHPRDVPREIETP